MTSRAKQRCSPKKDLHILDCGSSLHLNFAESEQIAAPSIANYKKQSCSVSLFVQNSVLFRNDTERNWFEVGNWVGNIYLIVNDLG